MLFSSHRHLLVFLSAGLTICLIVAGLLLALNSSHIDASNSLTLLPPIPTVAFMPAVPSSPEPTLMVTGTPPPTSAKAVYLMDANTANPLDDWQGELSLPMASTTKIMTALLAIQSGQLDQLVTIHQDALDEVIDNDNATNAGLQLGEQIPLRQLLYGLMLPSGNDAAVAIADTVGGSRDNFVHMMNVEAYRLQLFSTHYTSPDGLIASPDHYTTAYDLARLARYAMHLPLFATIVSQPSYTLPRTATHSAHLWINTDELLAGEAFAYPGATGIKTGHTDPAGYCLVFSATRNNRHLIGVLLNDTDTNTNQRFQDARALLDWGFALPVKAPTP